MENTKAKKKKFKLNELTKVVKKLPEEEQKKIYYMAKGAELIITTNRDKSKKDVI